MIDARSYQAREALRNGQIVTIRAIRPEDGALILEIFPEIDPDSLYMRFFEPKREITEQQLRFFTEVDFINHVALVVIAEINGKPGVIGGGRYVAYDHPARMRSAEIAFMVHDRYQGQGIATKIMKHLLVIARDHGIEQFEAEVLAQNAKMLAVFSRAGLRMNKVLLEGVFHVTLSLSSDESESL